MTRSPDIGEINLVLVIGLYDIFGRKLAFLYLTPRAL
jgi:hypothetical protein